MGSRNCPFCPGWEDRATRFANAAALLSLLLSDPAVPGHIRARRREVCQTPIDANALDLATRLAIAERQVGELDAEVMRLRAENAALKQTPEVPA
ncbi:hypothetical protein [Streptomyces sp. NPDC059994]|uniref:hypothetical protein n=1 Tax=Streptomyces sp. NPDC059994 TaxID=3347029 RepID=UPI0036A4FE8A